MTHSFKGRREDFRLVTGRGRFSADNVLPNQAHAQFLRADRAHAEIVSIDISAALALPGVLAVVTGKDLADAGFGPAPSMVQYPGKGGSKIITPPKEVMAHERVRFVGQEVALVVAETADLAQDAVELITVDYKDLPAVVNGEAALAPDAPQLYPGIVPNNLVFDYAYGDEPGAAEAFAGAAHVTKLKLHAQRIAGVPMEPKAALVSYDAAAERWDCYVPTQGVTMSRGSFAGTTGLPPTSFRIHAQDVGGGFGVRSESYSEYCALLVAAKKVGRPVHWVGTRSETLSSDHHGRAATITGELALDADGRFLAFRFEWIVECGGYLSGAGPFINTLPPASHASNVYRVPTIYGLHRLVLTNTTPTTAYRGAARPNVSYIVERLVDEAARETGRDRVELRRLNALRREDFPHKAPPLGAIYDSGDPVGLMDEALKQSDWSGYEARRQASLTRGKLRGRGVAIFIEPAGGGASPTEEVAIKFGSSGNPVIYSVSGPSGQGHETVYPEIVARVFGIHAESVTSRSGDPDGPDLKGDGTIGSRSTMSHGVAAYTTALEVVRKGKDLAAKELEAAAEDIEFADGKYTVRGTDVSISFMDLARRSVTNGESALDSLEGIPAGRAFPTGAHVAEVEIDIDTGKLALVNYVAVDDCGNILSPMLVEGQLHGGIVQGLGQVFGEQVRYDSGGQVLTGSFMDYDMPRADDVGPIHLFDRGIPTPNNPLGVKGAGEAGTTGAVPTLGNAVIDALRPLGIHHLDMPYTSATLWKAIQQAGGVK
jgi:carbon-monoxide dehydrogenase large subunit